MVVTVLSAMHWASLVKLVAIENVDSTVLKNQAIHHGTIGRRSCDIRFSTVASSMTNTGAHSRLTSGTQLPARSIHGGRGSASPRCANAAERRAISQFVNTMTHVRTAKT